MKRISLLFAIIFMTAFTGCEYGMTDYYENLTQPTTFMVRYDANGGEGNVPVDSTEYREGAAAIIKGNDNNIVKSDYYFSGWGTFREGGVTYTMGDAYFIESSDVTLYARWSSNPVYQITYDANGADSGSVPVDNRYYQQNEKVAIPGNPDNLGKTSYYFSGWNTSKDGDGTNYTQNSEYIVSNSNVTLYAKWIVSVPCRVIYNKNLQFASGDVPVDNTGYAPDDDPVILGFGDMNYNGYHIKEWNTQADGTGTSYQPGDLMSDINEDVNLYAIWIANPVAIDTGFGGGDGMDFQTFNWNMDYDYNVWKGIAIYSSGSQSGKIAVGGQCFATNVDFIVARYSSDGTLDTSFNSEGYATTHCGTYFERGEFVYAYSGGINDGKILSGGHIWNRLYESSKYYSFALIRYNTDGSLDTGFGNGGWLATSLQSGAYNDSGFSVAVQGDGKIILAGKSGPRFALARYNSDGSLDTAFGSAGYVITQVGDGTEETGMSVLLQPSNQKIVVAGYTKISGINQIALVRYNTDGSIDTSFGNQGIAVTTASKSVYGISAALQGSKIIVGGYGGSGGINFILVRYNSDGSLDGTFGSNGITETDRGILKADRIKSVTIDSVNRIIVAGSSSNGTNDQFVIARYTSDGALDRTFGGKDQFYPNGFFIPENLGKSSANSVIIYNNKIYAVGQKENGFVIVRCNND